MCVLAHDLACGILCSALCLSLFFSGGWCASLPLSTECSISFFITCFIRIGSSGSWSQCDLSTCPFLPISSPRKRSCIFLSVSDKVLGERSRGGRQMAEHFTLKKKKEEDCISSLGVRIIHVQQIHTEFCCEILLCSFL